MAGTTIGRQSLVNALIMTSLAFRHSVRTQKGEASHVVIELGLGPEVLQMTVGADR